MAKSAKNKQRRTNEPNAVCFSTRLCHSKKSVPALRHLIAPIVVLLIPFITGAQVPQLPQTESGDAYTLHLNADMVILSVTVLDRHNIPVSGLTKNEFQVYEDGVLQQVKYFRHDDSPVTVGLVIDNSSSMAPHRDDVITAALAFARSRNPQDQAFVVKFNEHVTFGLPPDMPFTDQKLHLQQALSGIAAKGQTALYDGIAAALDHLKQSDYDKKVLILISDGGDNASTHTAAQVIDMAQHSTAIIYAIGIFDEQDGDKNPAVLRRLAKETGGKAYFPKSFSDIVSLCEQIAHDIQDQYTLAYVPARAMLDGRYRAIDVKASMPGRGHLSVRARTGYSVPINIPDGGSKGIHHDTRH